MSLSLNQIWSRQADFDRKFIKKLGSLTQKEKRSLTRDRLLYIIGELVDMAESTRWKEHRKEPGRIVEGNVQEEIIDIFKYWTGLCLIWDLTPEDILREWKRKTLVVEQRYRQEFEDPWDPKRYKYCAVLDIDGVIADWEGGFRRFVKDQTGHTVPPFTNSDYYAQLGKIVGHKRAYELKHKFREEGYESSRLDPIEGAQGFLKRLRKDRAYILLMTSRPYEKYRRIMADTLEWLWKHSIEFNSVLFSENKEERIIKEYSFARFVLEDTSANAERIARKGIPVLLRNTGYNQGFSCSLVKRFSDFKDLENLVWRK